ncbi:hypothetical protein IGI04_035966, partial [Brassica rapa subsp. trilocularis]
GGARRGVPGNIACIPDYHKELGGYNALEYLSNSIGVGPRKEPCPSAGNSAALPPAKQPEKMLTLHQGVMVLISSTHLEKMGVKEAGEHMLPLQLIEKKKAKPLGFSFQVPDLGFQVPDPRATRINKSHQHAHGKVDSRRGDESSSDIQKTLGVARPSGGR